MARGRGWLVAPNTQRGHKFRLANHPLGGAFDAPKGTLDAALTAFDIPPKEPLWDDPDGMERASKGAASGGWLGRWLKASSPLDGILPVLAVGSSAPESTRGSSDVVVTEEMEQLIVASGHDLSPLLRQRLKEGFGNHPLLGTPVQRLITLSETLDRELVDPETGGFGTYKPSVEYPDGYLTDNLMTVARAIKPTILQIKPPPSPVP